MVVDDLMKRYWLVRREIATRLTVLGAILDVAGWLVMWKENDLKASCLFCCRY
jgi:hypothetical protein